MHKTYLLLGIVFAGIAVALGAFGAHGLKKIVTPEQVATFQTGVQYQMYHALALMLLAIIAGKMSGGMISTAGIFFVLGVLMFSGSLYLITALHAASKPIPTPVVIITPLGGLCFIVGWILFLLSVVKN